MTGSSERDRDRTGTGGPFKEIAPPEGWKRKIAKGRGLQLNGIEASAREAIEWLRDDYLDCARRELIQIDDAIARARSGSREERDCELVLVGRLAHEMRGQAETFGYPLITTIGTSLCGYIEEAIDPDSTQLQVIEIHAMAMYRVIAGDIKGDGGKPGEQLLAGMQAMVAKTLA